MSMKIIDSILSLLYPKRARCLGCGDLSGKAQESMLCERCQQKMEKLFGFYRAQLPNACIRMAFAPYPYAPPVKGLIRSFKFNFLPTLAEPLADDICRLMEREGLSGYDCIVPVPLHRRRQYERGYNQSFLLAQQIAGEYGLSAEPVLKRNRATRQQARLSASERRKNLLGAFSCTKPVDGLRILLVDDVLTTGTTAASCAQALIDAGAASVDVCSVAIARHSSQKEA